MPIRTEERVGATPVKGLLGSAKVNNVPSCTVMALGLKMENAVIVQLTSTVTEGSGGGRVAGGTAPTRTLARAAIVVGDRRTSGGTLARCARAARCIASTRKPPIAGFHLSMRGSGAPPISVNERPVPRGGTT